MSMLKEYLRKQEDKDEALEKELGLEQRRMYATERDSYLNLHLCMDIIRHVNLDMPKRLESAGAKDEMLQAEAYARDALKRVWFTIPKDQRPAMERNADNVTYCIGVKAPGTVGSRNHDREWGLFISYEDLRTVTDALHDHCLVCTGAPDEQAACALRKVFDRLGVDADHTRGECGYRELI